MRTRLGSSGWLTPSTAASSACALVMNGCCAAALNYLPVTVVFAAIILGSIYFLYTSAKTELAPQEDQGVVIALAHLRAGCHAAAAPDVRTASL